MKFERLLREPGVEEVLEVRSRFGFLAVHGGLDRMTERIAAEAAARADASLYAVVQPPDLRWHLRSIDFDPECSPAMRKFLEQVDVVISVHGYGRDAFTFHGHPGACPTFEPYGPRLRGRQTGPMRSILLGGQNRQLARRLGDQMRAHLPEFRVIDTLELILASQGVHRRNPVNLPPQAGVQVELPPPARGLGAWGESPCPAELPPSTVALIDVLASMATA